MVDVLEAVIAALEANNDVSTLTANRIYGIRLAEDEIENMPRKCIVLRYAGGAERNDFIKIISPRIYFYSYGESEYEAGRVDRAVYVCLKNIDRLTINGTLIHGVAISTGPISMESAAGWPIQWRSAVVTASETEIT